MNSYYGVIRSTDHLAHYGVTGMRWGVRRAIVTGNQRALDRHYRRAARKLAKLQNIGDHSAKYAAKAVGYGAGAAGAAALAGGGTDLASKAIGKSAGLIRKAAFGLERLGVKTSIGGIPTPLSQRPLQKIQDASGAVKKWGEGYQKIPVGLYYKDGGNGTMVPHSVKHKKVSNNTLFRIGAGAAAAGLAAKSAQNAYRARNGEKYREKAERFKEEMDNAFKGTDYEGQYAKLSRRQQRRRRGYS